MALTFENINFNDTLFSKLKEFSLSSMKIIPMDHIPTFGSRLHWKELIGYFRNVSPKHVTLTSLEYCPFQRCFPKARDFNVTGILSIEIFSLRIPIRHFKFIQKPFFIQVFPHDYTEIILINTFTHPQQLNL